MANNAAMKTKTTKTQPLDVSKLVPLTVAAKAADVSEQWLRKLIKDKRVVGLKIGRNYVVDIDSAKAFTRHPYLGRPRAAAKPSGASGKGKK